MAESTENDDTEDNQTLETVTNTRLLATPTFEDVILDDRGKFLRLTRMLSRRVLDVNDR